MSSQAEGNFPRRPLGYQRGAVDEHVLRQNVTLRDYAARLDARKRQLDKQIEESRAMEAEIQGLRSASIVFNASDEISALLQSFAVNVSTMWDQAERDAASTRAAADAYVEDCRAQGDRLFTASQAKISGVVHAAREEIQTLAQARESIERSLKEMAAGLQFLLGRLEASRDPFDRDAYLPPGAQPNDGDSGVMAGPAPDTTPASGGDGPAERDVRPLRQAQLDPDHAAIVEFEQPATLPEGE